MNFSSIDHLQDFEFHDSEWELLSCEAGPAVFAVRNLNLHKGTELNDGDWDMELGPAQMVFRGFRLIRFEPGRSWTTDESGASVPVGERVVYTGAEALTRLSAGAFQVFSFAREGGHWEFDGCGPEPYFTVALEFDSVEITWDSFVKKAWYELHRHYSFQVTLDAPWGHLREKMQIWVHEEDTWSTRERRMVPGPSVVAGVRYEGAAYWGRGSDDLLWIDAVADLQRKLPEGVVLRACLSCRHGNLCPFGNEPNEVFCLIDAAPAGKMDVAALCDDHEAWSQRKKGFFDTCPNWAEPAEDVYTYNDFADFLKER